MCLADKIDILYRVFIKKEYQADLAKEYRVTISAISKLVGRIRERPSILSELLSKRDEKKAERAMVANEVRKMG